VIFENMLNRLSAHLQFGYAFGQRCVPSGPVSSERRIGRDNKIKVWSIEVE
jgi:hypothetical protein